jgi:hypothetical protein
MVGSRAVTAAHSSRPVMPGICRSVTTTATSSRSGRAAAPEAAVTTPRPRSCKTSRSVNSTPGSSSTRSTVGAVTPRDPR